MEAHNSTAREEEEEEDGAPPLEFYLMPSDVNAAIRALRVLAYANDIFEYFDDAQYDALSRTLCHLEGSVLGTTLATCDDPRDEIMETPFGPYASRADHDELDRIMQDEAAEQARRDLKQ